MFVTKRVGVCLLDHQREAVFDAFAAEVDGLRTFGRCAFVFGGVPGRLGGLVVKRQHRDA